MPMTPEIEALKARLKAIWMAGDYGHFAHYLQPGAMEFFPCLHIAPGERVLDVACGAGQLALPAARAGATVTGVDIATNLIEQARSRAKAEGLEIRFEEGDAEDLPCDDAAFDVVFSLIGAMFAPRPEQVATELDPDRQAALRSDLEQLWSAHNQARDGGTEVEAEYLEVAAIRA